MHLPVFSRNFTDYLCSAAHILNAGKAMRGTAMPLPPSFTNVPIGYTGYSSSLIVSGTNFVRPKGLLKADKEGEFVCAPSARMDYELEVGVVIGKATARGEIVTSNNVADHIFGLVLVNDWSGESFVVVPLPWLVVADCSSYSPRHSGCGDAASRSTQWQILCNERVAMGRDCTSTRTLHSCESTTQGPVQLHP